jgi:hypothetical protein
VAGVIIESPVWRLDLEARTQDDLIEITEAIALDCRAGCPIDSGAMLATIHTTYTPGNSYIHVGTDHWPSTEYGSVDHEITPRGPGYPLRFFWLKMGRWASFWRVHHPGTPAQPFMRPALLRRRAPGGRL